MWAAHISYNLFNAFKLFSVIQGIGSVVETSAQSKAQSINIYAERKWFGDSRGIVPKEASTFAVVNWLQPPTPSFSYISSPVHSLSFELIRW